MAETLDTLARPMRSLRISVTDQCNLRCQYCMPREHYEWLPKADILDFGEIRALVGIFTSLGVDKIRLTGGEPLLRKDLHLLVRSLADIPTIRDLALTTNGVLLGQQARALREAGLHRLTVSLDTLKPERFRALTKRDSHAQVLAGVDAARAAGFDDLKLDVVLVRGVNDDEIGSLLGYGTRVGAEVRFIEYMDVGGATEWSIEKVVSRREILETVTRTFGPLESLGGQGAAPAARYRTAAGTVFGIISSTTQPFCQACDRGRLTADGIWLLCLYAKQGYDLRSLIREGASRETIASRIESVWRGRADRGAELRLAMVERATLAPSRELKADPHLEMHTRGG